MDKAKPFCISKHEVWEAYKQVKGNRGAAGVDRQSMTEFEADLKNKLYRIWNRMSSGSYVPPPVLRVDIPKAGGGTRPLGIPTVSDRIAQMVVKRYLQPIVAPVFHEDSYGYRPGRSAHHALSAARQRCWRYACVLDLDIKGFFNNIDWEFLMRAVRRHTDCAWVLLYIERWLKAPVCMPDGLWCSPTRVHRKARSSAQYSRICSCITCLIGGCRNTIRKFPSSAMLTMPSVTAKVKRMRVHSSRNWRCGWRNACWSFIQRKPRSCTAKMQTDEEPIRSASSISWATHSGREAH
ncbi:hypothetical protein J8I34_31915 [Cupriavidus sp. AcVe19-6a]|nr:hypothetical protein [Cupriavidus sp. AcVe19-6a]